MINFPFYTPYDDADDYYYSHPYYDRQRYAQQMRRQRELEEAHRRAEVARYLRLKEEEEQRKRYQAELHRRKEEEEYRRRLVARELARQQQQEAYRKRLAMERMRQRQAQAEEEQREPTWKIVRGPDGRLYRILLNNHDHDKADAAIQQARDHVESDSDTEMPELEPATSIEEKIKKESFNKENTKIAIPIKLQNKENGKNSRRKKKVTVIVEDASDSEDEDDPTKSVWRNRRPSPGQWMEPIESFY